MEAFLIPLPLPSTRAALKPAVAVARVKTAQPPSTRARRAKLPNTSSADSFTDHALLKPHQERALLLRIRVLHTHESARENYESEYGTLPTNEQLAHHLGLTLRQLSTQRRAGIRARNDLVSANLRLVVKIATQVHSRLSRTSPEGILSLPDLVQEGCIALIRAAERFDLETGNRFVSYAYKVVQSACMRAAPASSIVTIPERLRQASKKLRQFRAEHVAETGKTPSIWAQEKVSAAPLHLVTTAENHMKGAVALDMPVGGGASTVMDFVPSGRPRPEDVVDREMIRQEVRTACYRSLSARQADVLVLRFGLNGDSPMLAKDIAKLHGISAPRVAQIVLAAIERLRRLEPDLAEHIYDL